MRFSPQDPPRVFIIPLPAERGGPIPMGDFGRLELDVNEQISFTTSSGGEFDVARMPWGFFATSSLNSLLPEFGLRPALLKASPSEGPPLYFILLVEISKQAEFRSFMELHSYRLVCWLDSTEALGDLESRLNEGGRHAL